MMYLIMIYNQVCGERFRINLLFFSSSKMCPIKAKHLSKTFKDIQDIQYFLSKKVSLKVALILKFDR